MGKTADIRGGRSGYNSTVKPLLASLPTQLSQTEMSTLRTELDEHGAGVGQLAGSLSRAVPNASTPHEGSNLDRQTGA